MTNYDFWGSFYGYILVETLAGALIGSIGFDTNFILSTFAYNSGLSKVIWGFFFSYFFISSSFGTYLFYLDLSSALIFCGCYLGLEAPF